jgi:hypothetical protein
MKMKSDGTNGFEFYGRFAGGIERQAVSSRKLSDFPLRPTKFLPREDFSCGILREFRNEELA